MQALVILVALAWFAATGWAGVRCWRRRQWRIVAAGAVATAVLAPVFALLLITEMVAYYGGAFHESSLWLKLTILFVATNLAAGYISLVGVIENMPPAVRVLRVAGIVCISTVAVLIAVTGWRDGFPAASWLHWLLLAGVSVAILAGLGLMAFHMHRQEFRR